MVKKSDSYQLGLFTKGGKRERVNEGVEDIPPEPHTFVLYKDCVSAMIYETLGPKAKSYGCCTPCPQPFPATHWVHYCI